LVKENCGQPPGSVARLRAVHTSWNSWAQPTATTWERPAVAVFRDALVGHFRVTLGGHDG